MAAPSSRFFRPDRSCSRQAASKATANSTVAKTTSAASIPELSTIGPTTGGDSKTASRAHDAHSRSRPEPRHRQPDGRREQNGVGKKDRRQQRRLRQEPGFRRRDQKLERVKTVGRVQAVEAGSPRPREMHRRLQVVEGVVGKEVNQAVLVGQHAVAQKRQGQNRRDNRQPGRIAHGCDDSTCDFSIFAQLSFNVTVRLKTSFSGVESRLSTQKYPSRSNWYRLPGAAAFRLGST